MRNEDFAKREREKDVRRKKERRRETEKGKVVAKFDWGVYY